MLEAVLGAMLGVGQALPGHEGCLFPREGKGQQKEHHDDEPEHAENIPRVGAQVVVEGRIGGFVHHEGVVCSEEGIDSENNEEIAADD